MEIPLGLVVIKHGDINLIASLLSVKKENNRGLSNFQYIVFFQFEFSVLLRKISEYLQSDSPSDVNSQKIRALLNTLSIKHLYFGVISRIYNRYHSGIRLSTYQRQKHLISHPDIDEIIGSNGLCRSVIWMIWDYATGYTIRT